MEEEGQITVLKKKEKIVKVIAHVPINVARDSQFPFKETTKVVFTIKPEEGTLIVKRVKVGKQH